MGAREIYFRLERERERERLKHILNLKKKVSYVKLKVEKEEQREEGQ